jgi:hypothetical protein
MARTAQISKEKCQSIITLRHEGQSIHNISRTLKVSTSAVAKTSAIIFAGLLKTCWYYKHRQGEFENVSEDTCQLVSACLQYTSWYSIWPCGLGNVDLFKGLTHIGC